MNLLDKLERKFGNIGIRGLMNYIIGLNVVVFLLITADRTGVFLSKLVLVPQLVLQGEVWRMLTFILIPPVFDVFWLVFALYLYYLIGSALEHEWGTFRFNVYYFTGVIATIAGSLLTGIGATSVYLNLTLFLAFAMIYPNFEMLIFFVLPVKIKYLAWLDAAFLVYSFITKSYDAKIMIIASMLNFLLFFGKDLYLWVMSRSRAHYKKSVYKAKVGTGKGKVLTVHRCEVCGRSEWDDKNLEFRYCVDCEGDHEYCMEHLYSHEHVRHIKN